jgi:hypothetical protein
MAENTTSQPEHESISQGNASKRSLGDEQASLEYNNHSVQKSTDARQESLRHYGHHSQLPVHNCNESTNELRSVEKSIGLHGLFGSLGLSADVAPAISVQEVEEEKPVGGVDLANFGSRPGHTDLIVAGTEETPLSSGMTSAKETGRQIVGCVNIHEINEEELEESALKDEIARLRLLNEEKKRKIEEVGMKTERLEAQMRGQEEIIKQIVQECLHEQSALTLENETWKAELPRIALRISLLEKLAKAIQPDPQPNSPSFQTANTQPVANFGGFPQPDARKQAENVKPEKTYATVNDPTPSFRECMDCAEPQYPENMPTLHIFGATIPGQAAPLVKTATTPSNAGNHEKPSVSPQLSESIRKKLMKGKTPLLSRNIQS